MVSGDVGYLIANMKSAAEVKIGDTITGRENPATDPLPGFKEIQPMVFSGIYPVSSDDFEALKLAMGKLQINDACVFFPGRILSCSWVRLPLRLSRPPSHGDYPRAFAP